MLGNVLLLRLFANRPSMTLPLKMSKSTKHRAGFVTEANLHTDTFVLIMNKDAYAALPDDLKAMEDAISGSAVSALFGARMDAADIVSCKGV